METDGPVRKLRVLVVLTSNARRGAEIEGSELARQLRKVGIDAEAVCLAPATASSVLDVRALGSRPLGLATLRALRRHARESNVVIAYGSSTLPACALALLGSSVPFVYRSIGDPSAWVRGRLHRWRTGWLIRRSTHIVALWPGAASSIEQLYGVDEGRISVIPNARSSDDFRPPSANERDAARSQFGLPTDATVVGCIGSISAEKRVNLAVDAIARLDGVHLLVVGDGPDRAEVETYARRALGERVTFTGVLADVTAAYWAIDALLLTSRTEGMPGVVLEATLTHMPVVATDVGAVRSMFDRGIEGEVLNVDASAAELSSGIDRVLHARTGSAQPLGGFFDWPVVVCAWNEILYRSVGAMRDRSVER